MSYDWVVTNEEYCEYAPEDIIEVSGSADSLEEAKEKCKAAYDKLKEQYGIWWLFKAVCYRPINDNTAVEVIVEYDMP